MQIEQFKGPISTATLTEMMQINVARRRNYNTYRDQYNTKKHRVMSSAHRPRRDVNISDDPEKPEMISQDVCRIPSTLQRRIVLTAAMFLVGRPIKREAKVDTGSNEEKLIELIDKIWDDNKLEYKERQICKRKMSETEVAVIWYFTEADDDYWLGTANEGIKYNNGDGQTNIPKFNMQIVSPEKGDVLYPVFDVYEKMIAFGRGYSLIIEGKKVDHLDLHTDDNIIQYKKVGGLWQEVNNVVNVVGKIMVEYYSQDVPEWHYQQEAIERIEECESNHGDTNDYNGSPTLVTNAKIVSFSKKGERGKLVEIDGDGKVEYLSWNHAPESIKMEIERLYEKVYVESYTPNTSLDKMMKLGHFSTISLKMIFLDPHMKAADHEETYGEIVQRRINMLKSALIAFNPGLKPAKPLSIKPVFEHFLPRNEMEQAELFNVATGGKPTLSQQSAIEQSMLTRDVEEEIERIEAQKKDELDNQFNTEI